MNKRVLIVGGGLGGMETALSLSKAGIKCLLVEKENKLGGKINKLGSFYQEGISPSALLKELNQEINLTSNVEVYINSHVEKIRGEVGNFKAEIKKEDENIELDFGFIVFSTGFTEIYPDNIYKIEKNERNLSHLELEELLKDKEINPKLDKTKKKPIALFIHGINSDTLSIASAMKNGLILNRDYGYRVLIVAEHIKVEANELEKLYNKAREEGVIFFRMKDEIPKIRTNEDQIEFFINDEQLGGLKIRVFPDFLILEHKYKTVQDLSVFDMNFEIDVDKAGFYQQENVHLIPVETNRKGIFVVGGCRKIGTIEQVILDVRSAAIQITNLLNLENEIVLKGKIEVDAGKCALCLTCQRYCANCAITYSRIPVFSELECQLCGVCVKECPNNALTLIKNKEGVLNCK